MNLKTLLTLLTSFYLVTGCGQGGSDNTAGAAEEVPATEQAQENNIASGEAGKALQPTASSQKAEKIDFDFLADCSTLDIWRGAIQGVPPSDAAGMFIMGQCSANKHYDLIVFSKRDLSLSDATEAKGGAIKKGIPGAAYYAFELPKKPAENPQDEFETHEYIFPSTVKVYQYLEEGWYLIDRKKVSSFEELGRLKLNTVYQQGNTNQPI